MSNRIDASGTTIDASTVAQSGNTKQHPVRAPPPSPVGQYLQVQDFTYPAHYLNSLPPKGMSMLGPATVNSKVDLQGTPEAQPLLPQNQSEVRVMSHLWPPPNQEISV